MTRLKTAPDNCQKCPALVKSRRCIVQGRGPLDAKILFVGEGPGYEENQEGIPFRGRSGRVLAATMRQAGIEPHTVYLTNATRCLPPLPRKNPTKDEIANCHEFLINEIKQINPSVIVALGAPAISSLYRANTKVHEVMGFTVYNEEELPGIPIIPTYHPSYIMRGNWDEVAYVIAHLRKAKRIADYGARDELGSYMGVTTLEELRALRDYLLSDEVDHISIDTETTGLSWLEAELLCISFSPEEGVGYSVPLLHRGERTIMKLKGRGKNRKEEPEQEYYPVPFWDLETQLPEVIAILQEILSSDKPKSGQNLSFDIRMLERGTDEQPVQAATAFNFAVNNVTHDTRMLSTLLQENLPANLTVLNAYWTDLPYYEAEIAPFKKRMWELADDKLWEYGGTDVDVVQRLIPSLLERVKEEETDWVYDNICIPLIQCATKMNERGVQIDLELFDKLCLYYKDKIAEKQQELFALIGREFEHPTYYQTIQQLLFEELALPLTAWVTDDALKSCKKCRKDNPCSPKHSGTSRDALKELNSRVDHPVLPILNDLKRLEKIYSTYLEGGKGGFRRHIQPDGRIYAQWQVAGADTGRYTCSDPNMMNPPKKDTDIDDPKYGIKTKEALRSIFIAQPGCTVLNIDWNQLEVWGMAYETGDQTLLSLLEGGEDVHTYVARKLCELGISVKFPHDAWEPSLDAYEWRQKYDDIRGDAKTFVFGIQYGLTDDGAATRLGCGTEEAGALIQAYTGVVFPTLSDYFARIRQQILRYHSVRNRFGRLRHFPEVPILTALNYQIDLEAALRVAYNFPIQSGGHDLHSLANIEQETNPALFSRAWPVLEMHDSLMLEGKGTDYETILQTAWMMKTCWEDVAKHTILRDGTKLGWKIPVEVQWGPSFGDFDFKLSADGKVINLKELS